MNIADDLKKTTRLNEEPSLPTIVGFASIVIMSGIFVVFDFSSKLLFLVNATISLIALFQTHSSASRKRQRLEDFQRIQAEELREWQARWQRLYQETQDATSALVRMRDGVVMIGLDYQVLLINPAAKRLLGLPESLDMTKRPFRDSVRYPELSRAMNAAYQGKGTQKLKLEIQDGEIKRPLKLRVDHFGAISDNHLLITVRDETESHRVDAMRREFIANISHELKTPLAAIKGYAETVELAINDDPEAACHFMKQIHGQCLRLERLIADMMQLARAQAGTGNLNLSDVSITETIQESLKSLQHVAESKNISLVFNPPKEPPIVRADPEALLTICNNLISNAVRYTPEHGNISVSCKDETEYWGLTVEDNGVGISETDQKRIFERFYRVDKRADSSDGGTGIGLSIVKNLVMTLGGVVRVTSRIGEGAKFQACIPKSPQGEKIA
jgi:two-component system phosphate regulon sensor histidine kinase PhoR